MFAVSSGIAAYSVKRVRTRFRDARIPLMGAAGAFVFAAQMINFTIPGTGSSGHIAGAVLLAALLGPAPAFLVMASVLLVQALFFADGGLLAYGANLFNMAFFGCFLAYPYCFRPIAGKNPSRGRMMAASCAACMVSLELGALCVTVETLLSGVAKLPFGVFAAAMLPIHLAIGLGEGLATGAVLMFVRRNLAEAEGMKLEEKRTGLQPVWIFGLAAIATGGGLSLLASGFPDGLEWSLERAGGGAEPGNPGGIHAFFAAVADKFAVLPDYTFGNTGAFGTAAAGIAGTCACAAILWGIGILIRRAGRKHHENRKGEVS